MVLFIFRADGQFYFTLATIGAGRVKPDRAIGSNSTYTVLINIEIFALLGCHAA
jgi:hypothetical protein